MRSGPLLVQDCGAGLRRVGGSTDYGGRVAGEVDVDEGREVRRSRTLKSRGQVAGRVDVFSVAAEGLGDAVVPGGQKLAAHETLVAVLSQLNLELSVPGRVVSDYGDEGDVVSDSGVVLHDVESHGAVAQDGDDPGIGPRQSGGQSEGDGGPNGARWDR